MSLFLIDWRWNRHRSWANDEENEGRDWDLDHTEAIFDEVIEGVAITVVGELVVGSRKLLEALGSDAREISGELRVLRQNHRASSHEAVDQRLLPHLFFSLYLSRILTQTLTLNQNKPIAEFESKRCEKEKIYGLVW